LKKESQDKSQGKVKRLKKWNQIPEIKSQDEYESFIKYSLNSKGEKNRKIKIGETTENTKTRIKKNISNIGIDNHGIIHASQKKHNLEPDDLLKAVDIINNADEIKKSNIKHQQNEVASFIKNINGNIELLVEIHESKDFLMVFNVWRKNKVRRRLDAVKRPPETNVHDVTQPTIKKV